MEELEEHWYIFTPSVWGLGVAHEQGHHFEASKGSNEQPVWCSLDFFFFFKEKQVEKMDLQGLMMDLDNIIGNFHR